MNDDYCGTDGGSHLVFTPPNPYWNEYYVKVSNASATAELDYTLAYKRDPVPTPACTPCPVFDDDMGAPAD